MLMYSAIRRLDVQFIYIMKNITAACVCVFNQLKPSKQTQRYVPEF